VERESNAAGVLRAEVSAPPPAAASGNRCIVPFVVRVRGNCGYPHLKWRFALPAAKVPPPAKPPEAPHEAPTELW
jgi:hypothetical protein